MGEALSQMDLAAEGILGEFEGTPVTRSGCKVNNATKALNNALEVTPMYGKKGDTGFVVFQFDITDISHPNVLGHEDQSRRVHTLHITDACIMDTPAIQKAINAQRDKIIRAREERDGVQRIVPNEDSAE
jgi:hypothetical protein